MSETDEVAAMVDRIAERMAKGKVVPVLGAGANMCGRPAGAEFVRGRDLPSGVELAELLANEVRYPDRTDRDLARVSQYLSAVLGGGSLYETLREIFYHDYPCSRLHGLLASLARSTREAGRPCLLFLTTNYDDGLERALTEACEPFDMLVYIAQGDDRGRFRHHRPDGTTELVRVANEYGGLDFTRRHVVIKIHGGVDRHEADDSYVITEDHYLDYLTRAEPNELLPASVVAKLGKSHLLFLGYKLRDWNLRLLLHRLWSAQNELTVKSWAIDAEPDAVDKAAWDERGVGILRQRLETFVAEVETRWAAVPSPRSAPDSGLPTAATA